MPGHGNRRFGGGTSSTSPPVTVTVVGPSDTLNTGSSFTLKATVHNTSSSAVTWSVVEAGGGSITAAGVYTAPATPRTYTVKATPQSDPSVSGTAPARVVIPVGHIAGYDVGVDYHAYGANFDQTAFVTIYNQPQVRQAVRTQLQGMADRAVQLSSKHLVCNHAGNDQFWRNMAGHFSYDRSGSCQPPCLCSGRRCRAGCRREPVAS